MAIAVLGCTELTGFDEISSKSYATRLEAVQGKVFDSGWLPEELPTSAAQILEVHSIDSGEMWVMFTSTESDVSKFVANCAAGSEQNLPDRRRTRRNATWWPEELTEGGYATAGSRWDLYFCPEMHHANNVIPAGVAVERENRDVWYWVKN